MIKKKTKQYLINKLCNQYVIFFIALIVTWQSIYIFKNPVDFNDKLTQVNMNLNGIKVSKKEGIEYAYFNNCIKGEQCTCKVLIHGIGDNFQNWSKVLKKLKINNKVRGHWVAFNYPGTGQSDPLANVSDFQVKRFSSILNAKMKTICPGPFDLIANSMGTWISFWWAIQYPQQVNSLFLMDAVGIYVDYTWFADAMVNPTVKKAMELHKRGYYKVFKYPEIIYKNTIENMKKRGNKNLILQQTKSLAIDKYLPDLKQKTFIGWGDSDKILPLATYYKYLDLIPDSRGTIFKNCGHIPNSECPEQVVRSLEKFYN